MSYQKRTTSQPLEKLKYRIQSMKSVDADFDFGEGMNADQLEQFRAELESTINGYNQTLADADDLRDNVNELERRANDVSERLLALVIANYGRDSLEYQRMGGIRKSEISRTGSRPETYNGNGSAEQASGDTQPVEQTPTQT